MNQREAQARHKHESASSLGSHASVREALRAGYDAGRQTYDGVVLESKLYDREVLQRVARRLDRSAIEASEARTKDVLAMTSLSDLFLTIACDQDIKGAWEALIASQAPRIDGLARSLGLRSRTDSVGRDLLADLSAPPASGRSRTRIGTYDGSGSLFAWLAIILRRDVATHARRKSRPPTAVEAEVLDRRAAHDAEGPLARMVDAEEGTRLVHAMQVAWRELSTREQLALHFKYGERLRLKQIGMLLGLSESGASRLVSGALTRIRVVAKPAIAEARISTTRVHLWTALWQALDASEDATDVSAHEQREDQ